MKNNKLVLVIIGAIIGGFLVWIVMTSTSDSLISRMMTGQNTNRMEFSAMDAHFIEQMIPHHEDAITMAKVAQQKGQHPEIKTLANNIIVSQSEENTKMKSWYKEWFKRELQTGSEVMEYHGMMSNTSGMHMGIMGDESDIEELGQAIEFDKVFIEQMIPHHQMAIMMASMLKGGTTRPEMKKLAEDIITAQTKEIDQMRQWYKSWGYE